MRAKFLFICLLVLIPNLAFSYDKELEKALKDDIADALYYKKHTKDSTPQRPYGHCRGQFSTWDDVCQRLALRKIMNKEAADIYEQRFYEFQNAIKTRNIEETAKLMSYPFSVFYPKQDADPEEIPVASEELEINTPQELEENYDFIFNQAFIDLIVEQKFSELWVFLTSLKSSNVSFWLYCSGKEIDFDVDPKKHCKTPDAKVYHLRNMVIWE